MNERTCLHCGVDISARNANAKFCGKPCRHQYTKDHETRPCSIPECERKLWARGLCAPHYNYRHHQDRHRKVEVECCVCGVKLMRRVDSARAGKHCCSVECRRVRQWGAGAAIGKPYSWNDDAKSRARSFGCTVIEDVDRIAVMERDGWRCYQCGKDTSLVTNPFSPDAATVDHVIPLSHGGEHSMRNVRCCCLACNASKADREKPGRKTA